VSEDTTPTPEELAYDMYEALTDPFDAAVLEQQLAEGQPVEAELRERQRELEELRPLLVPERDQVADVAAHAMSGEVRITEAEWQALYLASRALGGHRHAELDRLIRRRIAFGDRLAIRLQALQVEGHRLLQML
jgi:hypothetical protein